MGYVNTDEARRAWTKPAWLVVQNDHCFRRIPIIRLPGHAAGHNFEAGGLACHERVMNETNHTPAPRERLNEAADHLQTVERYLTRRGEQAAAGCYWRELETNAVFWSPVIFDWIGLSSTEGAPSVEAFWNMIEPASLPRLFSAFQHCCQTRGHLTLEYAVRVSDGTCKSLWSRGHFVPGGARGGAMIVGTVIDLTGQRRARVALERVTDVLRSESGSTLPRSLTTGAGLGTRSGHGGLSSRQCARVSELIEARISEPLAVTEMAAAAGLSAAHFTRAFRQHTGQTPYQYVLARKLERARAVLECLENEKLANVAVEHGFFDQAHFTRRFRKRFGVAPGEFLRQRRGH